MAETKNDLLTACASGPEGTASPHPSTEADAGWSRERQDPTPQSRPATEADTGWRRERQDPTPQSRPATEADTGWRRERQDPTPQSRPATEADTGWRRERQDLTPQSKPATEADTGWAAGRDHIRQETQNEKWKHQAEDLLGEENLMYQAGANTFASIGAFRQALVKVSDLTGLSGKNYLIKKSLSESGGEAAVLLVSDPDGQDMVAKVYFRPVNGAGSSVEARMQVLAYMKTDEGKEYTLAVTDIGLIELKGGKYYFEIMPFCPDGDISDDGMFSFDQLVTLTERLNEALHSIHSFGILHRDIKPDNLFLYNGKVVIGDFGVAKLANAGATEFTVRTIGFAPPETQVAISSDAGFFFDERVDYYALGATLACLFEGHFIYDGFDANHITMCMRDSSLPLTRDDPHLEEFRNLVDGLYQYDANHRFGYEDVKKWLQNHNYQVSAKSSDGKWKKVVTKADGRPGKESYRDAKSLFFGITQDPEHWKWGVDCLYSDIFGRFFSEFDTALAYSIKQIREKYANDTDKGLSIFLKMLYAPGPIVWRGYTFQSLSELAASMQQTKNPVAYGELLSKKAISYWLGHTEGISVPEETSRLVEEIETLAEEDPALACYWFGNSFSDQRCIEICEAEARDPESLQRALFSSAKRFYLSGGYDQLMNRDLGARLYGFLYSLGYRELVEKEWAHAADCDEFNKASILFSMLDNILVKENVDPRPLRSFFTDFGPLGIAEFTRQVIMQEDIKVYEPLSSEGKQLLDTIRSFDPGTLESTDTMFRRYIPLVNAVDKMRDVLVDNPFNVSLGLYGKAGILCTNLIGCFAFQIFGRLAPLGFNAWLESDEGGYQS